MIFLFRKEIKKWNTVWWVVLASLVFGLGGTSIYLIWNPDRDSIGITSVNGESIPVKTFRHVYGEMKSSFDDMAMYWGIPAERLAKVMGIKDMMQSAMDRCVQNLLLDKVVKDFRVKIDDKSFQDALAKTATKMFIDRSGKLNLAAYQNYLSRLQMNVRDYEKSKEKEFKRNTIVRLFEQGSHLPQYVIDELGDQQSKKKRFKILSLPFDHFLAEAKKEEVPTEKLKAFFKKKQELYKVSEKMRAQYWVLTPEDYKDKVDVSEELIGAFYEKNKSSLYRIPPKVKVRTIVVKVDPNASPDSVNIARKSAQKLYEKATKEPEKFSEFTSNGGLIDFFQRGTHDPELERVAFLKLKEKGDISEIVRTAQGFEIIKLEDRIPASEKPLSAVREDVVKTLVDRKSIMALRADLEAVVRTYKTDKEIFKKFSGSNSFKAKETDWLDKDDADGHELLDVLSKKMFEYPRRYEELETFPVKRKLLDRPNSYFVHRGKHVLYLVSDWKDSYLPKFETIEKKVLEDWYAQEAEKLQKEKVKALKKALIAQQSADEKPQSIDEVGKMHGFGVITTKFVQPGDKIEALKDVEKIVDSSFVLTDPAQIFRYKHDSDYYLVQFLESKDLSEEEMKEKGKFSPDTVERQRKQRYSDAFVATLQRNARIEINQKLFNKGVLYSR